MKYLTSYFALFALLGISAGCSTFSQRNPVPVEQLYRAQVLSGVPAVRAWAGTSSEQFMADLTESVRHEMITSTKNGKAILPTINVLTLSGGADHGAFGAGFMNGWTTSGTRPEFKFVTGVSTGAIIAPFAFLGPEYDGVLKEGFTTIGAEDIYQTRGISALWSDSLVDSTPLERLIKKYVTQDVLQAVARAHQQGRRLYIGTTHMDADRLVVWNMGVIANSGDSEALALFRKVIFASSSIPLVFSPVCIKVKVDGVMHDEMHVDGGVKTQLFLTAATINLTKIRKQLGLPKTPEETTRLFIIRNAQTGPQPKSVSRKLNDIMERSISLFVKSQARSDLIRIYNFAQDEGFGFNWIAMPKEYEPPPQTEAYDTAEMNKLYNIGYEMGIKKDIWRKLPPGMGQH